MPTYEYLCHQCGHSFELFQSITALTLAVCTECGEEKVKRCISGGSGIDFKGSGFYVNDYSSKNKSQNTTKGENKG